MCEHWFKEKVRKIDCIFADPPDGIGLDYNEYNDHIPYEEYVSLLRDWLPLFCAAAETVWISFNSRWLLEMAKIASEIQDQGWEFKSCVQTFSFYQHNKHDLGNAHRPLWRFRKSSAPLYPEQVKIPSWRQLHGDKRATKGGKVPGDSFDFTKLVEKQRRHWHERAIQCGEWVVDPFIPDDHFDFTRVVGTSKQRRVWHPTQLNEGLVERCILMSTRPGDWVVDPFAGTGTTLRVCRKQNRVCTLIESDMEYCRKIAKEHDMKQIKDNKWLI
jgi:site-specific DNA-methyltransferase (adenine-specific)